MTRWFKVQFEVCLEVESEDGALAVAKDRAKTCAEQIDEYMGSSASGDPFFYRTRVASVEPIEPGTLPLCSICKDALFDEDSPRPGTCWECGEKAGRVVESDGSVSSSWWDPTAERPTSNKSLDEVRAEARAYLEGLRRGVR